MALSSLFFTLLFFTNQSSSPSQVFLFLGWSFPLVSFFVPLPQKKYDYHYIFAFIVRTFDNYFVPFTFLTFPKYNHLLNSFQKYDFILGLIFSTFQLLPLNCNQMKCAHFIISDTPSEILNPAHSSSFSGNKDSKKDSDILGRQKNCRLC